MAIDLCCWQALYGSVQVIVESISALAALRGSNASFRFVQGIRQSLGNFEVPSLLAPAESRLVKLGQRPPASSSVMRDRHC